MEKIRFATDQPTFTRAVQLYESGKVTQWSERPAGFSAVVHGTHPYAVSVSARRYDEGTCTCYLGVQDVLCKHMVAVAIYAVAGGRPLREEEKESTTAPTCSGRIGILTPDELKAMKASLSAAMRYIKPYNGPSRIWFAYQNSLTEGCNRLSAIVCELPVSRQTARLLISLLLRLDKKLSEGGVDDSDGTVGAFIEETVHMLQEFTKLDSDCIKAFEALKGIETCFGWEEPLIKVFGVHEQRTQDGKI